MIDDELEFTKFVEATSFEVFKEVLRPFQSQSQMENTDSMDTWDDFWAAVDSRHVDLSCDEDWQYSFPW